MLQEPCSNSKKHNTHMHQAMLAKAPRGSSFYPWMKTEVLLWMKTKGWMSMDAAGPGRHSKGWQGRGVSDPWLDSSNCYMHVRHQPSQQPLPGSKGYAWSLGLLSGPVVGMQMLPARYINRELPAKLTVEPRLLLDDVASWAFQGRLWGCRDRRGCGRGRHVLQVLLGSLSLQSMYTNFQLILETETCGLATWIFSSNVIPAFKSCFSARCRMHASPAAKDSHDHCLDPSFMMKATARFWAR